MEDIVKYIAVDSNGEFAELPEGTRVITDNQRGSFKRKKDSIKKVKSSSKPFVFIQQESAKQLKELDTKDLGYLLLLMSYTDYLGLIKLNRQGSNPMTKKEMRKELKIKSEPTLNKLLKRLIEKGIIYEDKIKTYRKERTGYFVSPEYCFRKSLDGPTSDLSVKDTVRMFMDTVQEIYHDEKQSIKAADIGFLYRVLPYIHYSSNLLVVNPDEPDENNLESLSVTGLSKVVGLSRQLTSTYLNRLQWKGQFVFARTYIGNVTEPLIKVNPYLFYRKSGDPVGIGADFLCSKKLIEKMDKELKKN